jgi:hypothetical protein
MIFLRAIPGDSTGKRIVANDFPIAMLEINARRFLALRRRAEAQEDKGEKWERNTRVCAEIHG